MHSLIRILPLLLTFCALFWSFAAGAEVKLFQSTQATILVRLIASSDSKSGLTGAGGTSGYLARLNQSSGTVTKAATTNTLSEVDAANSPGLYKITLTAAELADLGESDIYFKTASSDPVNIAITVQALNINDSVRAGLTAIPNAAAGANGGLPLGDASGRVDVGKALGTAVTLDANNVLNVSSKYWAGTAITATSLPVGTTAGASGGLFIAGSNAATTANITGNITGNLSGSVGSVTGAVGSVTGAVGSVTGAVGSVTGNLGGNVVGSVGSVTGAVGSVTGAVGSVTGAVGSVAGNVGGNVVGTVASVVGNVGGNVNGNVTGSVGSLLGITFPMNFSALGISGTGHIQLVDVLTTWTGATPPTGDTYARLGAPAGASHAADIAALPALYLSTPIITVPGTGTSSGTQQILTVKQCMILLDAMQGGDNVSTTPVANSTFTVTYYYRGAAHTAGNAVYIATVTLDANRNQTSRTGKVKEPFPSIP